MTRLARLEWSFLLEALLLALPSILLFTQACCLTTAGLPSMSASLVGVASDASRGGNTPTSSKSPRRPYFEDSGPRNVTAVVGHPVILNCRVRHPLDRTVSWMRKRDLHILTSSIHTYTGDGRFSVLHPEHSDDWDLHIDFVQKRDAGVYECQVNTEPKINMAVMLTVEESQASISGPADVYVKKGSTISLTCSVNAPGIPPTALFWYHGARLVDFDSKRGGVSLETEKTDTDVKSKLLITKAALGDSGNYTCAPPNAASATVAVHVLTGENPAAMQSDATKFGHNEIILTVFLTFYHILR